MKAAIVGAILAALAVAGCSTEEERAAEHLEQWESICALLGVSRQTDTWSRCLLQQQLVFEQHHTSALLNPFQLFREFKRGISETLSPFPRAALVSTLAAGVAVCVFVGSAVFAAIFGFLLLLLGVVHAIKWAWKVDDAATREAAQVRMTIERWRRSGWLSDDPPERPKDTLSF